MHRRIQRPRGFVHCPAVPSGRAGSVIRRVDSGVVESGDVLSINRPGEESLREEFSTQAPYVVSNGPFLKKTNRPCLVGEKKQQVSSTFKKSQAVKPIVSSFDECASDTAAAVELWWSFGGSVYETQLENDLFPTTKAGPFWCRPCFPSQPALARTNVARPNCETVLGLVVGQTQKVLNRLQYKQKITDRHGTSKKGVQIMDALKRKKSIERHRFREIESVRHGLTLLLHLFGWRLVCLDEALSDWTRYSFLKILSICSTSILLHVQKCVLFFVLFLIFHEKNDTQNDTTKVPKRFGVIQHGQLQLGARVSQVPPFSRFSSATMISRQLMRPQKTFLGGTQRYSRFTERTVIAMASDIYCKKYVELCQCHAAPQIFVFFRNANL